MLHPGDPAPPWTLLTYHEGTIEPRSLADLLAGNRALVLVTYELDFTGD